MSITSKRLRSRRGARPTAAPEPVMGITSPGRVAWYPDDPNGPDLSAVGLAPLPPLGATDWIEDHGPDGTRFGHRRVWCTTRPVSAAARRRLAAAGWVLRQDAGVTRFSRPRL